MPKRKQTQADIGFDDPLIITKRWLRTRIQKAITFWAPKLQLDSFVSQIKFYITEDSDKQMTPETGAEILVETATRTAIIKVKRGVIQQFAGEYYGKYNPSDILEMTILHELCHIITNPMSRWTHSTIEAMRSKSALERHFSEQEEVSVEHLTRVLFGLREQIKSDTKYNGKIIYLTKDPFKD